MGDSLRSKLVKIYRFVLLYGFERTVAKTASRSGNRMMRFLLLKNYTLQKDRSVSLIGCGQFGFATISYLLLRNQGKIFLDCYDINSERSAITAKFYGYTSCSEVDSLISNPKCKLIYIASNHHSHADYAIKGLQNGKDIYLEKPISVNWEQFAALKEVLSQTNQRLFVGYNRPHSQAARKISNAIKNNQSPISLNCFISGHVLEPEHWYRIPKEGTRICGNVGHWIDLMIHFMNQRGNIPEHFEVSISQANSNEIDDNLSISISTNLNDIASILITARTEPFEGIDETINFQCGDIIAKIDDFQRLKIWNKEKKYSKKYRHKDVGHSRAIDQPFLSSNDVRDWREIEISTTLMLEITDMVKKGIKQKNITIKEHL